MTASFLECLASKAFPRDTCKTFCFANLSYLIHQVSTHTIYTHITHILRGVLFREKTLAIILESNDYSTFDTHTHTTHKTFFQWMLISFVWLYMFKCDVYTQLLVYQTQNDFWVFYMFLKVFLCFRFLSFCSNCIFHVFHQKLLQRHFRKKLATKLFPRKWVKAKYENKKFKQKLLRLFRYCFASKVFPQKVLCFKGIFRE